MITNRASGYYQKALEALTSHGIGTWEHHPHSGKLISHNNYFATLELGRMGFADRDFGAFESYVHPEDLPLLHNAIHTALMADGETIKLRYRCRNSQGDICWLEDSIFSYKDAEDESRKIVVGYTRNIHHTIVDTETIGSLSNLFEKSLLASPGFIFIFDDRFFWRDIFISEGETLLHSLKELIDVDGRTVFSPEVSELYIANIHECLRERKLQEIEYTLEMNGVVYYFQARIVPFKDNQVLALIYDISNRVRRIGELIDAKHKAEEADLMKSTFLANMSHEIRTPLNAIVGFSEIIATEEDERNREEYLDIIRTNNSLLLQIINDILDISRIESGKSEIHLHDTDICALVDEISRAHSIKMKPGVEFRSEHPEKSIFISTDPVRVKQILHNFISNAIKNTESGSITMKLEVTNDNALTFSVTDTGRGIEPAKLDTIFNRFEKLNSFAQGTGLGLAISKGLVELLGGNVDVSSEVGMGSTFSFSLPLQLSSNTIRKMTVQKPESVPGKKKSLMLVEPSERDYKTVLNALGDDYDIVRVKSTEEALEELAAGKPFNLLLVNTPPSEPEIVNTMACIDDAAPNTPVIAIMPHGKYTERQIALKAGCTGVITKPYSLTNLREAIIANT